MRLALQIDDQETLFGPDDIVRGTVSLMTPGNVLVSEVSVVFKDEVIHKLSAPERRVNSD